MAPNGRNLLFARTGIQFLPFNTIYQLAAEDPDRLARADGLLMITDYFAHRLGLPSSGRPVGEITLASTSATAEARTRAWATDLLDLAGLPANIGSLLPRLVEPGSVIGDCDGIPIVATAAHDTAAAVVGCPAVDAEHWAFLSAGTWSLLGMELDEPVLTPAARAATG